MSKKGGHPKGKGPAKPAVESKPASNPLHAFLATLFVQAEARLVKAEQRSAQEVIPKVVLALEPIAKSIVSDPPSEGLQKHAIRAVLAINSSTSLGPAVSKKVVSVLFLTLVDELQMNWKQYGFKEGDVHPDYVRYFRSQLSASGEPPH